MAKDWRTRLTDTYSFIRTAQVSAHGNLRAVIADELEHRFGPSITQATSDGLSQGSMLKVGTHAFMNTPGGLTTMNTATAQSHRSYRRAITLIRAVILNQPGGAAGNAVAGIQDNALQAQLGAALQQAEHNLAQRLTDALNAFKADPGTWLARNKVYVQTFANSGSMQYRLFYNYPQKRYDFVPPAAVGPNGLTVNTQTGQTARVVSVPTPVHHVHVQNFTAIQPNNINGTTTGGGDVLMVTTQLSGCSLVYQIQGGTLVAAHVQPGGPDGSAGRKYNLCVTLRAQAAFANGIAGAPVRVFGAQQASAGPGDYVPNTHTHIVGVRRGGTWELHAQQGDSSNPNTTLTTWPVH